MDRMSRDVKAPIGYHRQVRSLAVLAVCIVPLAARAGEVACHFEGGVVVAPAEVAGAAGDYLLDTGDVATRLHETRAQAEGISASAVKGDIRIAGEVVTNRPVLVTSLDARTYALPTPVAGVVGYDVLKDYVVDVSFSPCRLALWRPGHAPPFAGRTLPLLPTGHGLSASPGAVSDGPNALAQPLAPSTALDRPVRLPDDLGRTTGEKPVEAYPGGAARPRLRALSFAGELYENLGAGLVKAPADGLVGGEVLARFRVRFDFPGGRLILAPAGR